MTGTLLAIACAAVAAPLLAFVFAQKFTWLRRRIEPDAPVLERLQALALRSLDALDVPVGAVVLYEGRIIGEGFNTVLRDRSAGGHAEINAITSALAAMGVEAFMALDRRKLMLVSTFEPCIMCAGACVNYNIRIVYYLEEKDAAELLAERRAYARYLFRRLRMRNRGEQRALFRLHPGYPGRAADSSATGADAGPATGPVISS